MLTLLINIMQLLLSFMKYKSFAMDHVMCNCFGICLTILLLYFVTASGWKFWILWMYRRCMNRAFNDHGIFHFSSESFKPSQVTEDAAPATVDELFRRISTVIVDELDDSVMIHVDKKGFQPRDVTIKKVH